MWRTVIVSKGEKITVKNGWMIVYGDNIESHVPIEDIYSVVIDNRAAYISVQTVTTLAQAGAAVYFCDEKHIPTAVNLPLNNHCKPFGVLKKQLEMSDDFKKAVWQKIVTAKINNQCKCLSLAGIKKESIDPIKNLAKQVTLGDSTGKEATAAKLYFPTLFGPGFFRYLDEVTKAALNYGYAIMRSSVAKTLVAYGYNCSLGIHHRNETNPFNLADDFMEPLRPVVDYWVDSNCDDLLISLTNTNRKELVNLINTPIDFDGKKMRIRYAVDRYIQSFTTAVTENDPSKLIVPKLIKPIFDFEDELDG